MFEAFGWSDLCSEPKKVDRNYHSPIRHIPCLFLNTFFVLGNVTILPDYAIPKYACTGMICVATWFTSLIYKAFAWAL